MRRIKLRTYSFVLTLLCSTLYVQAYAQNSDGWISERTTDKDAQTEVRSLDLGNLHLESRTVSTDIRNSLKHAKKGVSSWLKDLDIDAIIDDQIRIINNLNLDLKLDEIFERGREDRSGDNRSDNSQATEKVKTISKSYSVDKDDKLRISNQYGKVTINTWDQEVIKVDVKCKVSGSTDSRAQAALDRIHINESKRGSVISFETVFDPFPSSNRSGEKREVSYEVYMPATNSLDIKNGYGNTLLMSDFNGAVNIQQSYGNLKTANLNNSSNTIRASYSGVSIGNLKTGNLDISYGNLKLGAVGKLDADISYSPAKIERISGDLKLTLNYGEGLKIARIDPSVKNINIDATYSSVALAFDPDYNFNFAVMGNHSPFNFDRDRVTSLSTLGNNTSSKMYNGKYGKESDNRVSIRSTYGSIKFD